ncbi:hypothetical protein J7E79_02610 [Bacillus sp. ISL-40]|uniref:hypothetical protein n=1 Tax=unclassified Bacillus (in: firmicutes) TaxID=185979 RepID=UPI001BEC3391|nr:MULTISPECIES: hypothetical protein [unclassified Bacillus (in: firmicutes)]MBT2696327.1 hypothetical protein [Bacillus sp. ISL-40]MBT2743176.1 hypothetical protein [Bacillus sp. ISL-77]
MGLDLIMSHDNAKQKVKEDGWDSFLETFQKDYEPYKLYSCSTYWYDDSQYICKFRGVYGDVVIGWDGIHNK